MIYFKGNQRIRKILLLLWFYIYPTLKINYLMKKIVFILLAVLVLGVIAMMTIKKEITVDRSITINAPREKISEQIRYFKQFVKWSPWAKLDPAMKMEFFGEDGTVGAKYTWSGNDEVGTGSQELMEVTDQKIKTKDRFHFSMGVRERYLFRFL